MMKGHLIRGGQTAVHEYRMSLQVVKTLAWIIAGITLIFTAFKLYLNLELHEAYQWVVWHWANTIYNLSMDYEQRMTMYSYDWEPYVTYIGWIIEHPHMTATKDRAQALLLAGLWNGLLLGLAVAFASIVYFLWRGISLQRSRHLRGSRFLPPSKLASRVKSYNRKKGKRSSYTIAGVPFPIGAPVTHTMICGAPGTGKTSLLVDLVAQIRKNGDRAIIYDKMGGFVGRFYDPSKDVICNPFDVRTPHWSVFSEGRKVSDFEMMAKALIPEQKGMTDPFWILAARILFSKVADGMRIAGNPTNELLVSKLLKIDLSEMAALLKNTAAQSIIDTDSPKTALSVRAVMTSYLACLEHLPEDTTGELFSIREWIENDEGNGFMFLSSRADMHESIKGLTTCWLEIAVNSLLSLEQSSERKVWIILDEVPSLFNIPSLQPGMAESRQFGGCFVLGLQVWSAMRDIYGNNGAETLSGLARTRVILSTPDKSTADWCSQALGNEEKTELQETLSYGAHEMRDGVSLATRNQLQPIVLPTEIMSLPDLTGFLRLPQGFPVARFTIKPNTTPTKVKSFVERPHEPVQTGKVRISPPIPDTKPQKKVDRRKKPKPEGKPRQGHKQKPAPETKAEPKPVSSEEKPPDTGFVF